MALETQLLLNINKVLLVCSPGRGPNRPRLALLRSRPSKPHVNCNRSNRLTTEPLCIQTSRVRKKKTLSSKMVLVRAGMLRQYHKIICGDRSSKIRVTLSALQEGLCLPLPGEVWKSSPWHGFFLWHPITPASQETSMVFSFFLVRFLSSRHIPLNVIFLLPIGFKGK